MNSHSDFDKVTDQIYIGNINGANNTDKIIKEGISHILSLIGDYSPTYESDTIVQKVIDVDDLPSVNIIKYFKECIEFINESSKVYVHCMCGISRSSTIVIAFLMWKTHATYNESLAFVRNRRKIIEPNEGFVKQLRIFEKLLKDNDYELGKINFSKVKWPQK